MQLCKLEDLKGGEILASAVFGSDYQVLLSEGSIIREEHIYKLRNAGIEDVFIKIADTAKKVEILKQEVKQKCHDKVKTVLERHTYHQNDELEELRKTVEDIIYNILDEETEIVEKVYDLKERTPDIYEHSVNVCSLSILTALKLKLDKNTIYDIGVGSLIHDVGLRYINVMYKDMDLDYLPEKDLMEYKKHPVYAYSSLCQEIWITEKSKNIILMHHEHVDGKGFPLKLRDIPVECKIVNICDTFDEMICGIGYSCLKVHEVVETMKKNRDTHHDGKILDTFLEMIAIYPAGSFVKTNEGEIGIVMRQNKEHPDKPYIKIIKDKKGDTIIHDLVKDLSSLKNVSVIDVIE